MATTATEPDVVGEAVSSRAVSEGGEGLDGARRPDVELEHPAAPAATATSKATATEERPGRPSG
jgi:hypothetical protein